ncbi:MAG: hypothetical protein HYR56_20130 [Acidobacteria bacterium]|nr:hypothetical protein [Acidobacteriota bacterium]MBI3424603.1 hypothetical protein [Acidobacteriota bacterium]
MKTNASLTAPLIQFAAFILTFLPITFAQNTIPPIATGYGAEGTFTVLDERFASPLFPAENVHVFLPAERSSLAPVIFFAPGFSVTDPASYRPLINHIVSRGYAVVFSPFQIIAGDGSVYEKRYDTIFAGYEEAVRRYGMFFDLTRVAFIGHSFGGGASFAMLQRGAVGKGWGSRGVFLFAMAPWYVYEITTKQLLDFPSHAKLLVQVYDADTVNDHRIAKEVFERTDLPASEKDFVLLRSDQQQGVTLDAAHGTPSGQTPNALDYYGIWRLFDALADYAFNGAAAGKDVALGNGSAQQRFMGVWPNGQPVKEALAGDCVTITRASSSFLFPYDQTIHDLTALSAASFKAPLAPASIGSAFGKLLSAATAANSSASPPVALNGTALKVRDSACVERFAPLFFVSPGQINFLLPAETATGAATLIAQNDAGEVSLGVINVNRVAPGLFAANANGQGVAAALALRIKPDGQQVYEPAARYDDSTKRFVAAPIELGNADDQVFLLLFGTGWRNRSDLGQISVTLGGQRVEALFAGAQGSPGLDQMNLRLPRALAGRGEVDVVLQVDGQMANTVRVSFK